MSSLLKSCENFYGSRDLYVVLKISKNATEAQIRKAYHKLSLLVHPDKVDDDDNKEEATQKFQVLGKIYSILSNKEKRAIYDETGTIDEEVGDEDDEGVNWVEFWRRLFKPVTITDIDDYEKKYKGSEEEKNDLKKAYLNGRGDMDFIYESVPFVESTDEPRIRAILQEMIDNKEITAYKQFINEPAKKQEKRKRKYKKEAEEAKEIQLSREATGTSDLAKAILSRQEDRNDSFLQRLEAKYSKAGSTGKSKGSKNKK